MNLRKLINYIAAALRCTLRSVLTGILIASFAFFPHPICAQIADSSGNVVIGIPMPRSGHYFTIDNGAWSHTPLSTIAGGQVGGNISGIPGWDDPASQWWLFDWTASEYAPLVQDAPGAAHIGAAWAHTGGFPFPQVFVILENNGAREFDQVALWQSNGTLIMPKWTGAVNLDGGYTEYAFDYDPAHSFRLADLSTGEFAPWGLEWITQWDSWELNGNSQNPALITKVLYFNLSEAGYHFTLHYQFPYSAEMFRQIIPQRVGAANPLGWLNTARVEAAIPVGADWWLTRDVDGAAAWGGAAAVAASPEDFTMCFGPRETSAVTIRAEGSMITTGFLARQPHATMVAELMTDAGELEWEAYWNPITLDYDHFSYKEWQVGVDDAMSFAIEDLATSTTLPEGETTFWNGFTLDQGTMTSLVLDINAARAGQNYWLSGPNGGGEYVNSGTLTTEWFYSMWEDGPVWYYEVPFYHIVMTAPTQAGQASWESEFTLTDMGTSPYTTRAILRAGYHDLKQWTPDSTLKPFQISETRWSHDLRIRQPHTLGENYLTPSGSAGYFMQDWQSSYYYFDAVGNVAETMDFWLYDATTGESAPLNQTDLIEWFHVTAPEIQNAGMDPATENIGLEILLTSSRVATLSVERKTDAEDWEEVDRWDLDAGLGAGSILNWTDVTWSSGTYTYRVRAHFGPSTSTQSNEYSVVATLADADGDGMSDKWETLWNLKPGIPDANSRIRGMGMTAAEMLAAGLVPTGDIAPDAGDWTTVRRVNLYQGEEEFEGGEAVWQHLSWNVPSGADGNVRIEREVEEGQWEEIAGIQVQDENGNWGAVGNAVNVSVGKIRVPAEYRDTGNAAYLQKIEKRLIPALNEGYNHRLKGDFSSNESVAQVRLKVRTVGVRARHRGAITLVPSEYDPSDPANPPRDFYRNVERKYTTTAIFYDVQNVNGTLIRGAVNGGNWSRSRTSMELDPAESEGPAALNIRYRFTDESGAGSPADPPAFSDEVLENWELPSIGGDNFDAGQPLIATTTVKTIRNLSRPAQHGNLTLGANFTESFDSSTWELFPISNESRAGFAVTGSLSLTIPAASPDPATTQSATAAEFFSGEADPLFGLPSDYRANRNPLEMPYSDDFTLSTSTGGVAYTKSVVDDDPMATPGSSYSETETVSFSGLYTAEQFQADTRALLPPEFLPPRDPDDDSDEGEEYSVEETTEIDGTIWSERVVLPALDLEYNALEWGSVDKVVSRRLIDGQTGASEFIRGEYWLECNDCLPAPGAMVIEVEQQGSQDKSLVQVVSISPGSKPGEAIESPRIQSDVTELPYNAVRQLVSAKAETLAIDANGNVEQDPSSPKVSVDYPVIKISSLNVTNIVLAEDGKIRGDVSVVGTVESDLCDFVSGARGQINQVRLLINDVDDPIAQIPLQISKGQQPESLSKPFPYLGVINATLSNVPLTEGANVLRFEAWDEVFFIPGFSEWKVVVRGLPAGSTPATPGAIVAVAATSTVPSDFMLDPSASMIALSVDDGAHGLINVDLAPDPVDAAVWVGINGSRTFRLSELSVSDGILVSRAKIEITEAGQSTPFSFDLADTSNGGGIFGGSAMRSTANEPEPVEGEETRAATHYYPEQIQLLHYADAAESGFYTFVYRVTGPSLTDGRQVFRDASIQIHSKEKGIAEHLDGVLREDIELGLLNVEGFFVAANQNSTRPKVYFLAPASEDLRTSDEDPRVPGWLVGAPDIVQATAGAFAGIGEAGVEMFDDTLQGLSSAGGYALKLADGYGSLALSMIPWTDSYYFLNRFENASVALDEINQTAAKQIAAFARESGSQDAIEGLLTGNDALRQAGIDRMGENGRMIVEAAAEILDEVAAEASPYVRAKLASRVEIAAWQIISSLKGLKITKDKLLSLLRVARPLKRVAARVAVIQAQLKALKLSERVAEVVLAIEKKDYGITAYDRARALKYRPETLDKALKKNKKGVTEGKTKLVADFTLLKDSQRVVVEQFKDYGTGPAARMVQLEDLKSYEWWNKMLKNHGINRRHKNSGLDAGWDIHHVVEKRIQKALGIAETDDVPAIPLMWRNNVDQTLAKGALPVFHAEPNIGIVRQIQIIMQQTENLTLAQRRQVIPRELKILYQSPPYNQCGMWPVARDWLRYKGMTIAD